MKQVWVSLLITLGAAALPAQDATKGTLLEGIELSQADSRRVGPPPAEMKVNQGTFQLEWGSTNMVMGHESRNSRSRRGWVELRSGERLEGKFSIKAKRRKKESEWTLAEIHFEDQAQQRSKIDGEEVYDFGFHFKISEYRNWNRSAAGVFNPGTITLADGSQRTGLLALTGSIGDARGAVTNLYFAENEEADVERLRAGDLSRVSQKRDGASFDYVAFRTGIVPILVQGKNFMLFRNPVSTTKATGFRAGLAKMGTNIAADQLGQLAAAGAAKGEMEHRINSGQDLGSVVRGGNDAANSAYAAVTDSVSLDPMKPEYVIRNVKSGVEVVVSDENYLAKVEPLVKACHTTAAMGKDELKELTRFKNLESLVKTLDSCF